MSHRRRNAAQDRHGDSRSRESRPISAPPGRSAQSEKLRQPWSIEEQIQREKQRHQGSHHNSERHHSSHHESKRHHRSHHDRGLHEVEKLRKPAESSHIDQDRRSSHDATAGQSWRPASASVDRSRRLHHSVTSNARGEQSARSSGSRCSSAASGHRGMRAHRCTDHERPLSESHGGSIVSSARVVPQPVDGSCLFHSLSHGLGKGDASSLRNDICRYIEKHPDVKIADAPLKSWVKHDSGCDSVRRYASQMKSDGCWGGGIEMAALAKMKGVNVHVYEKCPKGFQRISAFDVPKAEKTINVLYRGRTHYDALEF